MAYAKALIVDDSKLARITLKRKIEALGVSVVLAESGKQAIDVVHSEAPDIVFMDHLMPEMDGFEATQALRADPRYVDLPIIMCTGKDHDGYLLEAQAIGANHILSKPPVDEALQALLSADFMANNDINEVASDFEQVLESESIDTLETSSIGAEAPILDMNMLGGDDLLDEDFVDAGLGKDVLADFSSDSLDIGTNVLESTDARTSNSAKDNVQAKAAVVEDAGFESDQTHSMNVDDVTQIVTAAVGAVKIELMEHFKAVVQADKTEQAVFEEKLNSHITSMISDAMAAHLIAPAAEVALPKAEIESLCQAFIANERISLVAEVLASVPEPKLPEFDVPRIDYDKVDQQLATLKSELLENLDVKIATSEKSLLNRVETMLNNGVEQVASGISEEAVTEIATARANEAGSALTADFNQQLKQREKILLQHLEVNKAATVGLLAEMQAVEPEAVPSHDADIHDELDILRQQQQQLQLSGASKTLAYSGLLLGLVALGTAVWSVIA